MPAPFAVFIVPTWNRRGEVLACVESILATDYQDFAVVVVDNGSVDGTSEALAARFGDRVVTIRHPENRGYAGGNNSGIRWAMERGAAYVCLVNNDARVEPGYLRAMVDAALADSRIAAIGSRNLELEDPRRLWGAFGELTWGPFIVRTAGQGQADGPSWRVRRDVDWVIGNGSLWSCAAIAEVGLLDEELFAYHDDVDWCVRFRRAGYRVVYAGDIAIAHRGGGTSDIREEHFFPLPYYLGRNGILFARKHGSAAERLRYACWSGAAMLARWLRAVATRSLPFLPQRDREGHRYWDWEVSYARGVVDGLFHKNRASG